jgi:ATP phosphoribosyltransferase regulatory subunit
MTAAMPTTAETARQFDALEAQAQRLMATFTGAGCEFVAPAIIQPAGLMLDVVGEDLRARTYVFSDADGAELCLRPDLTVPTCRLYLERHPDAATPARYCYNGPAFRYRPLDAPRGNPREFRQAGVEAFALADAPAADAEIVALTHAALAAAGAQRLSLRLGDIGILSALLDAIAMPEPWRESLRHQFWRPDAFRLELKRLTTAPDAAARRLPKDLVDAIDLKAPAAQAEAAVAAYLDRNGIEHQGARSLAEIAAGVAAVVADARAKPLSAAHANLIEQAIAVTAPAAKAVEKLAAVTRPAGVDLAAAYAAFERRLGLLKAAGVAPADITYSGEFGRKFEYYTGFVFEFVSPELGASNPVAGGGRYDSLLGTLGAPRPVPAVGVAIYTERLLSIHNGSGA